jgi:hypothetical protein
MRSAQVTQPPDRFITYSEYNLPAYSHQSSKWGALLLSTTTQPQHHTDDMHVVLWGMEGSFNH